VNYQSIKDLATEQGARVSDFLALSEDNDPFYSGRPSSKAEAEWFLGIWKDFGFSQGVHVRRIHYRIVTSKQEVSFRDGTRYLNTEKCWKRLQAASAHARYQGLIDPSLFVDRRAAEPQIFSQQRDFAATPGWEIDAQPWRLPSIKIDLAGSFYMPAPDVAGYDYHLSDQRYRLAVAIEKSTMNDLLEPFCARYGIDLLVGTGVTSITTAVNLLQRAADHARSLRVFYISDFDPAGLIMPVSLARQVEFWRDQFAPESDIKLKHLMLTREQINRYDLPRTPIKESDTRKRAFEERHGEGAVELDALEALRSGELIRVLEEAIQPYFDADLKSRLQEAEDEASEEATEQWEAEIEDVARDVEEIETEAQKTIRRFQSRTKKLSEAFDKAMAPLQKRLDLARQAFDEKSQNFMIELPGRPEAEIADADESDWIFDSSRDYLHQIAAYKRHKGEVSAEDDDAKSH
jgi:hypothetical protein